MELAADKCYFKKKATAYTRVTSLTLPSDTDKKKIQHVRPQGKPFLNVSFRWCYLMSKCNIKANCSGNFFHKVSYSTKCKGRKMYGKMKVFIAKSGNVYYCIKTNMQNTLISVETQLQSWIYYKHGSKWNSCKLRRKKVVRHVACKV